jgi:hypothetical protein
MGILGRGEGLRFFSLLIWGYLSGFWDFGRQRNITKSNAIFEIFEICKVLDY